MVTDEKLERHLAAHGVTWAVIPSYRHVALENEWRAVYDDVWRLGLQHWHGERAQHAYAQHVADLFSVVPFLGNRAGPHGVEKRGPRIVAYECRGPGTLPDLSGFHELDFFISPPDLTWTMLHTHEDYEMGGPYFIDRERLVPATRHRMR